MNYLLLSISIIKTSRNYLRIPLLECQRQKSWLYKWVNLHKNRKKIWEQHRKQPNLINSKQSKVKIIRKLKVKRKLMRMMMIFLTMKLLPTKVSEKMTMKFQLANKSESKRKEPQLKKRRTKNSKKSFLPCRLQLKKNSSSKSNKSANKTQQKHFWRPTNDSHLANNNSSTTTISRRTNTTTRSATICLSFASKILPRKILKDSTESSKNSSKENSTTTTPSKQSWGINYMASFSMTFFALKRLNGSSTRSLKTKRISKSSSISFSCVMTILIISCSWEITTSQRKPSLLNISKNEFDIRSSRNLWFLVSLKEQL